MARSRRRRRQSTPSFGGMSKLSSLFGHSPAEINRILADMGVDLIDDIDDFSEPIAEQWRDMFVVLLEAAPDALRGANFRSLKFEVSRIYEDGEMHGFCRQGREKFHVYARPHAKHPPAACSCPQSGGEHPCLHSVGFVKYLTKELASRKSAIRKMVDAEDFTPGTPDYSLYELDPSLKSLQSLELVIPPEATLNAKVTAGDDCLPARSNAIASRLAWRVDTSNGHLELNAIVQQPKKRGNGFTKGRVVKPESALHDSSLSRTTQDRRALDHIEYRESYYSYRDEAFLDPIVGLQELVGASNVFIDSTPVEVASDDLEFHVVLKNDIYHIDFFPSSLVASMNAEVQAKLAANVEGGAVNPVQTVRNQAEFFTDGERTIVRVSTHDAFISVIQVDPIAFPIVRQLMSFQGVTVEHQKELLARLKQLQRWVTIRVEPELAGPVVTVPSRLAVLLRSGADGTLDVALRIRDHNQVLRQPGASPAVVAGERGGKPVQFARNVVEEVRQSEQLMNQLHLSLDHEDDDLAQERFACRIKDFGQALEVMDQLQQMTSSDQESTHPEFKAAEDGKSTPIVEVLWDKNSEKPISVLGSLSNHNVRVEINRKRDWFGVSGQCDFGDKQIPLADLLENLSASDADSIHGDFIRLQDGQWARISEKLRRRLRRLRDATHTDRKSLKLDATSAPAIRDLVDDGEIHVKAVKAWQQCLERLARAESLDPQVPDSLDANLRDYQIDGFKWLRRLAEWGVGGILADDMGLGKTLQTLAVIVDRCDEGPTLVIAPTSVGFNWVREAERFAPSLTPHLYRETERSEFLKHVGPGDLVVCSYGLALRDEKALAGVDWGTLVLDEAQAIKNSRSKTSRAIAKIPAGWTVALTGTPVENHLGELWSLFHVVSPGVLGGWDQFRKRFAAPIEKHNDEDSRRGLAQRLQPFVLRRTKSEVLTELPPRTEVNLYVELSTDERAEYERVRLAAIGDVDQIESLSNTGDQRFRILALLTRLRQISCHAGLVNKQYEGTSAKLEQLRETLTDLKEEGHRALIFSQFTEHLALIRAAMDEGGFTYEYLDGSTPAKARQERVDAFQNGHADAFLISLKAGGTGLNLTAADYVIHMDPWWNPAVEDQATDRAHRIGQDKPVMVYRIVAKGTIEEEILALHETKRDLVAGVMDGTSAAAKLSNDELISMLSKRGE